MQNSKPSYLVSMKNWYGSNTPLQVSKTAQDSTKSPFFFWTHKRKKKGIKILLEAGRVLGTGILHVWQIPGHPCAPLLTTTRIRWIWLDLCVADLSLLQNSPFCWRSVSGSPASASFTAKPTLFSPFPSPLLPQKVLKRCWELTDAVALPC